MSDKFASVILAAGKGTRLGLTVPKPLAPILDETLIDCVLGELQNFETISGTTLSRSLITGHQRELVEEHVGKSFPGNDFEFVFQKEQLGTGHAVKTFVDNTKTLDDAEAVFVLCADTPCLDQSIFESLINTYKEKKADAVVATFSAENPFNYGRIVHEKEGKLSIVEEKEASAQQRKIQEVNSGLYLLKKSYLLEVINKIENKNNSSEFYLTDIFNFTRFGYAHLFENESWFFGVNDLEQLSRASFSLQMKINRKHMKNGVLIKDSRHTYISRKAKLESGSTIAPNVTITGETHIQSGAVIEEGSKVESSFIGENSRIKINCSIEDSKIGESCSVGPMAHLRPGTVLENRVKIGNFVETKKSHIKDDVNVSHLSYVGDAEIGARSNLGCGFITCNYDGKDKHKTIIGEDCFIGSDSQMIAPLKIGNRCFVASGSSVNQDLGDDAFAISRSRQVTKEGMAKRFLKSKT